MLFYFTGTGNCLYVARSIESNPISIPKAIHGDLDFTADSIGIVAQVYGHEVPTMVKDFLRRASFHTGYFYMVLTYGMYHGGAAELTEAFCRECGIEPAYIYVLHMVDNWLPSFDMGVEATLDKHEDECLASIRDDIASRRRWIMPVTDEDRRWHQRFLDLMATRPKDEWQHLIRVGDGCTGCGTCIKVCPSGSMSLEDGRAVFVSGRCQTCLACTHACPEKVIGLTVPEINPKARYRNKHVTLKDIMDSNDQSEFEKSE